MQKEFNYKNLSQKTMKINFSFDNNFVKNLRSK